jgi:hypothetical protein
MAEVYKQGLISNSEEIKVSVQAVSRLQAVKACGVVVV